MSKENKSYNNNISKGEGKWEEKGLQPNNVSNVGKPPLGGSNVKKPTNKK